VEQERRRLVTELKERRIAAGWTQAHVAALIGLSRPQVTNGESDNPSARFSLDALLAYAAAVGCRFTLEQID
jgi:transcriptional regulator with XRE-family HTH domain